MFDIIIYATAALVIVCGGLYLITVRDEKRGAAKSMLAGRSRVLKLEEK